MSRELHFPIPDADAETIKHIEPARIIDYSIYALEMHIKTLSDLPDPTEGRGMTVVNLKSALRDLKAVRNAWVLILGTARLQCIGGDHVPQTNVHHDREQ